MAAVVSTPVEVFVAAIHAGSSASGGASAVSITATFQLTGGWEAQIPLRVQFSAVSADPPVNIYRSTDGGGFFDTVPLTTISIARIASGTAQASVTLPTGQYAIVFTANISASYGVTFMIPTYVLITAINNL